MGQSSAKVDFVSNPGNVPVKRVKYLGSAYESLSTEVPPKSSQEIPRILTQNFSTHHQKKNVLSVACQFYNPTVLTAPLMFSIRSLFCEICQDPQCSINSIQGMHQQISPCSQQDLTHQKIVLVPDYLQLLSPAVHLLWWQPERVWCLCLCLLWQLVQHNLQFSQDTEENCILCTSVWDCRSCSGH